MKKIIVLITLVITGFLTKAQINYKTISLSSCSKIPVAELSTLINTMGEKQIVGLGEGTHGTKEFNELRISIIKELITNNGFKVICFENPFGDSYYLNQLINSNNSIEAGMKKYMIKLWQTPEVKDLLYWIRNYNTAHEHKVTFAGMDFNLIANSTLIIKTAFEKTNNNDLIALSEKLFENGTYYDSIWSHQNEKGFDYNFDTLVKKMRAGYAAVKEIDSIIKAGNITVTDDVHRAIANCRMWITGEENRDSSMAQMATSYAMNEKVIVWAHAVHIALQSPFADNSVGGTGGYIKKIIPSYFALGTGTADGTYSGTEEKFDTRNNLMHTYTLPLVKKDSWDYYFANQDKGMLLMQSNNSNNSNLQLPLRLIGYGPPKGIEYTNKIKLSALFDAYIFIKHTNANNYIN